MHSRRSFEVQIFLNIGLFLFIIYIYLFNFLSLLFLLLLLICAYSRHGQTPCNVYFGVTESVKYNKQMTYVSIC